MTWSHPITSFQVKTLSCWVATVMTIIIFCWCRTEDVKKLFRCLCGQSVNLQMELYLFSVVGIDLYFSFTFTRCGEVDSFGGNFTKHAAKGDYKSNLLNIMSFFFFPFDFVTSVHGIFSYLGCMLTWNMWLSIMFVVWCILEGWFMKQQIWTYG